MLAEELRRGDELPGVCASVWYGGRKTTTTSPLRVGCRESLPSTSRSSSFLKDALHDLLLTRKVRVVEVLERRDDLVPDGLVVGGRDLQHAASAGSRPARLM